MANPYPRPITLPEDTGLFVHYSEQNVYGIRFHNLYDEEEVDNWLVTEILEGRYKLYRVGDSNLFQAIKQTTNRSEREIIELYLTAEIDRPLAEGQLTIPADAWTVDEYPGVTEMLRWDPLPPLQLASVPRVADATPGQMPRWDPQPPLRLASIPRGLADMPGASPSIMEVARMLLDVAEPRPSLTIWDLEIPNPEPILTPLLWPRPFLLPMDCGAYDPRPSIPPPQKRIADILIADAVSKGEQCSISLNPLTPDTACCVAPCYHIFEKEAIQTWLSTKHTCPTCREPCSL